MVKDELIHLLQKKHANIGVIGLGYVGLPWLLPLPAQDLLLPVLIPIKPKWI